MHSTEKAAKSPYAFFEDAYPKAKPVERLASYEEQQRCATVRSLEPKKQLTERERLHRIHNWNMGDQPDPGYGWAEEWGPDATEEGHDAWYHKPKAYMTGDEQFKLRNSIQTPLDKGQFRHQEMPMQKRIKAAALNMAMDHGQWYDMRARDSFSQHSPEQQMDYIGKARQDYIDEWLAKPGVTTENLAEKMAEYNGGNKGKTVKKSERCADWELSPRPEFED
jgi:hypothetical protein